MKTRALGRTGIQVSPYYLGTMISGQVGNPDHDECIRVVHRALDAGINVIDTADVCSGGESEEILGKALKGVRGDVVLATKVNGPMGEGPNHSGSSRRLVWSPLAMGLLTGRHRKGRPSDAHAARMHWVPQHMTDERKLDALERPALRRRPVADRAAA